MAYNTWHNKRKLRASLQRELNQEATRLIPSLSQEFSQSLLPLAISLTADKAETVYRTAASRSAPPAVPDRPSNTPGKSDSSSLSLDVHTNTKDIDEAAESLDRLGASFDTVMVKSGKLDGMLKTTVDGIGNIIAASDNDAAKKAFGSLLKDVGQQAISGVQAMLLAAEAQSAAKGVLSFGTSLITDAPLIAAAYVALEGAKAYINSLDTGGVLVGDQLIMAHDKETVIPYDKAPAFFAEAVNRGAGATDSTRNAYRPTDPVSTSARVRVSFGDMRGALRQSEIRQARRSA